MASTLRFGLGMILLLGVGVMGSACGDDEEAPRRGGPGASCNATDDCEAPLTCVENVCGGPTTGPGGTGGTTGEGGAGGAGGSVGSGGTIDSVGPGENLGPCDGCVDQACNAELVACGEECLGIEVCLETQCRSALLDFEQEGACQAACQQQHSTGIQQHLDVVNCARQAYVGACGGTCGSNQSEHPECIDAQVMGPCAAANADCNASSDCGNYKACVESCSTAAACAACDDSAGGATGQALFEALNRCIALECISESWLLPPS